MLSLRSVMFSLLEIILMAFLFNNQVALAQSPSSRDIDKTEVEKWIVHFHESLFVKMNAKKTFDNYVFVGKITDVEAKTSERAWLKFPNKKVSKELRVRYARLNFERQFYEIFFLFGTKKLSHQFGEISYDDNGITTVEYSPYADFLRLELKKFKISEGEYISFFKEDKKRITEQQVIRIEKFLDTFLNAIKTKIDKAIFKENTANFSALWKVEGENTYQKYFLVTNGLGGAFIVAKKGGKIQIIDFPELIN